MAPRNEDPAYRKWVRENYPCEVAGRSIDGEPHVCEGRLEFAHIKGRGTWGDDHANGICLCTKAHTGAWWSIHRGQKSFAQRFNLDLARRAGEIYADYTFAA